MQEDVVKLEVNIEQLNVIMAGISKLPIEVALKTFNKIDQQVRDQLKIKTDENNNSLKDKIVY